MNIMAENGAGKILSSTIEKIRGLVDTSTIIGEAIYAENNVTIIPVSKVTYGFASGGADFPSKSNQELFGGGGGAGVTITPVAFLVISDGEVTLKHITAYDNAAERVVNLVPEMFDKVTGLVRKVKKDKPVEEAPAEIEEETAE